MAIFTRESIDRVRDAADMVEVVSAHTDLRRQGQRYSGLCPFHDERTPSFSVNPTEKLYYCFGCEASGDLFRFVQEREGLGFPEAVESLADRFGVELEREDEDPRAEQARKRRTRLYELLARAAEFYASYLRDSPKAAAAREYLEGRGLGQEVLAEFGVGFAPSAWNTLRDTASRAGFSVEELLAAGLAQTPKEEGRSPYDRFRSRITFPVRDSRGRVVGFGARGLTPDAKPKYLNSPEGELYRKSETLFGIDIARGPIAKAGRAVVVEGYTDVLALHQAGMREAVAIMGTAITPEQLRTLGSLANTVVLALDADRAGTDAMIRAQRVAGSKGLELRVVSMPEGEDPADMLSGDAAEAGLDRFSKLVSKATDLASFRVRTVLARADLDDPAARDRALSELAPVLAAMGEVVGRDELISEVADRLDTDPSLVSARVSAAPAVADPGESARPPARAAGSDGRPQPQEEQPARTKLTPRELRERALFEMAIASPEPGRAAMDRLTDEHLSPSGRRAAAWLREHLDDPLDGLPRDDEELSGLITALAMAAEDQPATAAAIELNFLLLERQRLEDEIAVAREAGDHEAGARLARERAEMAERITHAQTGSSGVGEEAA